MNKQELETRVAELEAQLTDVTTLTLSVKQAKGYHVYDAPGGGNKVYLPSSRIRVAPATITINVVFEGKQKVERKKLADMTPAEKLAHAKALAASAAKRAADLEAELLGTDEPATDEADTDEVVADDETIAE